MTLKPFWRYYGGKYRAAPHYPAPQHDTIIEPFAGAAGYSMRYPDRKVILCDLYPVIVGIWSYLIRTSAEEIRRIPFVEHVDALPPWVPQEARWLVGFCMNSACVSPCRKLSSGRIKMRANGRKYEGWSNAQKERVASQVDSIRHWRVFETSYARIAHTSPATWFIDPPYNNKAGSYYVHSSVDYSALGAWCRERRGQVIVCENEGADWLPFAPFRQFQGALGREGSREVVWYGGRDA